MAEKRKTELDLDTTTKAVETGAIPQETAETAPVTEKPPEEKAPEVEKKPFERKKLFIIAGAAAAVILVAVIGVLLLTGEKKVEKVVEAKVETPEEELEPEPEPEPVKLEPLKKLHNLSLEPFLINYETKGKGQFLKISLAMELSNKEAVAEVDENLVLVRDSIFFFIKGKSLKDFTIPLKRKETLQELKRLLDRSVQNGRVNDVLITELTVF